MKRLILLSGLFLFSLFVGRAGVGPGVASGLCITSPLMTAGQVAPAYSPPVVTAAPHPVYTPGPVYLRPVRPRVVPPLPGESSQASVVVTVGPIVHPEHGTRPISTPKTFEPTVHPEHGLRAWLHQHHWLR